MMQKDRDAARQELMSAMAMLDSVDGCREMLIERLETVPRER